MGKDLRCGRSLSIIGLKLFEILMRVGLHHGRGHASVANNLSLLYPNIDENSLYTCTIYSIPAFFSFHHPSRWLSHKSCFKAISPIPLDEKFLEFICIFSNILMSATTTFVCGTIQVIVICWSILNCEYSDDSILEAYIQISLQKKDSQQEFYIRSCNIVIPGNRPPATLHHRFPQISEALYRVQPFCDYGSLSITFV